MDSILKIVLAAVLIFPIFPLTYGISESAFAKEDINKELYKKIYKHISDYDETFFIEYQGNTDDLEQQLQKIMNKIKEENVYVYENISKWKANYTYTKSRATIKFKISYLTNYEQEQFVDEEIKRIAKEIISSNKTNFDKIKAAHDYAVLNTSYTNETTASQYTTYSLLTEGKAVCQGYAFFMYRVLDEMGIPVEYVKGYAGTELHGWNLVQLSGEWYHLDATWDDPLPDKENRVRYKYFLVSDTKISKTHSWDQSMYPAANSERYAPFHVASDAYTVNNQLYYRNMYNQEQYVMNLETLRSTKLISAFLYLKF